METDLVTYMRERRDRALVHTICAHFATYGVRCYPPPPEVKTPAQAAEYVESMIWTTPGEVG